MRPRVGTVETRSGPRVRAPEHGARAGLRTVETLWRRGGRTNLRRRGHLHARLSVAVGSRHQGNGGPLRGRSRADDGRRGVRHGGHGGRRGEGRSVGTDLHLDGGRQREVVRRRYGTGAGGRLGLWGRGLRPVPEPGDPGSVGPTVCARAAPIPSPWGGAGGSDGGGRRRRREGRGPSPTRPASNRCVRSHPRRGPEPARPR